MRFYARFSWRLIGQVVGDLFVLVWLWAWWLTGRAIDEVIRVLAEPARRTQQLAGDLQRQSNEAANQAEQVPVVGEHLGKPFNEMAETIGQLATSAGEQVDQIEFVASVTGWVVFLIPALLALLIWLPRRIAFATRTREVLTLAGTPSGTDLLALRALANQPLATLRTVSDDPVADWRAGDEQVTGRLAELELISAGVNPPKQRSVGR
ncbi:hypothetical protein [Enemella sp. A6]|uniref:hypothetical protein n=1 Tax=Enemella sp. A6 TaxID=3440152 RepID=UPI003EB8D952